ncbi:MAG: hypothetical protein EBT86_03630 [Actinobacteria bacterium]|nr:hypothetical protein [Actinomycetota bacterium]
MSVFSIQSVQEIAVYIGIGLGIYVFFFLLGMGFSSLISFQHCGKTDTAKHAIEGSIWAAYPTLAWFLIRPLEFVRQHFDRFYLSIDSAGQSRAGWISVGYVLMLACLMGIYNLSSRTTSNVCIPDIDEATLFKQQMLKRQQEKEEKIKEAQELTPVVSKVQ